MKFQTPFDRLDLPGEINSGEIKTEPGQAFTTREIYTRFLVTGRVEGSGRRVSYDSDELGHEPDFSDNVTPLDAAVDPLTAYSEARDHLQSVSQQRDELNRHIQMYDSGQISYDELCEYLRMKAPQNAPALIKYFGDKLRSSNQPKPKDTSANV